MGDRSVRRRRRRGRSGKLNGDPGLSWAEILGSPYWAFLEADFRREYRVDLVDEFRKGNAGDPTAMSWRSFLVCLRGLSDSSTWRTWLRHEQKTGRRRAPEKWVTDPAEAERLMRAAFGA